MNAMTSKIITRPSRSPAAKKAASKATLAERIKLPSGKTVTVGHAVEVATRAGILTKTGKLARFYAK